MSAATIAYHLRPNKAIERDVFLDLLTSLKPVIPLAEYRYVGFGGPFLEDFRLIRKRIGIGSLVCVEADPETHLRQKFNSALPELRCLEGTFSEVASDVGLEEQKTVVWLDYSDAKDIRGKIQSFVDLATTCQEESIIKLTLGAEVPRVDSTSSSSRLERARNKLGEIFPEDAGETDVVGPVQFSSVLLRALDIALSKNRRTTGLSFHGLSSFVYADGAPMVTVTGVLLSGDGHDSFFGRTQLTTWEHYNSDWTRPRAIQVPVLSLVEQRELAQGADPRAALPFALPEGRLGLDSLESYVEFSRLYPHFARVDL